MEGRGEDEEKRNANFPFSVSGHWSQQSVGELYFDQHRDDLQINKKDGRGVNMV